MQEQLVDVADPVGRESARTVALADALVAATDTRVTGEDMVWQRVRDEGVAWLLVEPGQASAETPAELVMSARELLTARYAHGEAWRVWSRELVTLPARVAVEAAHDDPDADREVRLAVLGQLRALRREHERLEDDALARAHDQGASWAAIGAALGTSRQSAYERGQRRASGIRSRASGRE